MIEEVVLNYLTEKLPVPVYMEIPADPPASFAVLEKTGGSRRNRVCTSMLAVQSYAGTLLKAAGLNEEVKRAMDSLGELAEVGAVRLNSDYRFTDTASKRHRYQAVYDVTHYDDPDRPLLL